MVEDSLHLQAEAVPPAMSEPASRLKQALIVLNPVAGNSSTPAIEAIEQCFAGNKQWSYEIYKTTGQEDMATLVRNRLALGLDLVVAAGGDGTISEVVDALVYQKAPLAIVPLGTGNVLAHELKIPLKLDEACDLLLGDHNLVELDVMQVNGKAFISHISIGIYSLIVRETTALQKRRLGRLAYLWTAFRKLMARKTWYFTLIVDDHVRRFRASSVLVANAGAVGLSSLRWGADICLDDGQLNICIIRGQTLMHYLGLVWSAFRNQHQQSRHINYLTAKQTITIKTKSRLPVRADGEVIGEGSVQIQVLPKALQVVRGEC